MGDFASSDNLNDYLVKINPRYGKYAAPLWDGEVRSPAELANASIRSLATFGISNMAHAENVQAHVKRAGQYQECKAIDAELLIAPVKGVMIKIGTCVLGGYAAFVMHIYFRNCASTFTLLALHTQLSGHNTKRLACIMNGQLCLE